MITKCLKCGKEFYTKPSRISRGKGKYCSRECLHNGKYILCLFCNKNFYISKSRFRTKYCSRLCADKDRIGKYAGINSSHWKGNKVGIIGIHGWLHKMYGKANKCENPICPKSCKVYNWSLLKGKKYERNRENFWMLCFKCHMVYDKGGKPSWNKGVKTGQIPWNKDKKLSEKYKEKFRLGWIKRKEKGLGIAWNRGKKGLQKGWNKGTKGLMKANSGSFKKGNIPWNK